MTLDRGFGKCSNETEQPTKCGCSFIQKSIICKDYGEGNGHHSFSCHDARKTIVLIGMLIISVLALNVLLFIIDDIATEANKPLMSNIEGYNCNQLAEYIADRSKSYTYAEHRYEWLCVNEKIKEFT